MAEAGKDSMSTILSAIYRTVKGAIWRFPCQTASALRTHQVIDLAHVHAVVAQDGISRGDVEIHIRQHPAGQGSGDNESQVRTERIGPRIGRPLLRQILRLFQWQIRRSFLPAWYGLRVRLTRVPTEVGSRLFKTPSLR